MTTSSVEASVPTEKLLVGQFYFFGYHEKKMEPFHQHKVRLNRVAVFQIFIKIFEEEGVTRRRAEGAMARGSLL